MIIDCNVHIHRYHDASEDCGADLLPAADRMGIHKLCVSVLLGGEQPTPEDIRRVAKRLMTPEGLRFVVVGQPVGVTAKE